MYTHKQSRREGVPWTLALFWVMPPYRLLQVYQLFGGMYLPWLHNFHQATSQYRMTIKIYRFEMKYIKTMHFTLDMPAVIVIYFEL